MVTIRVIIKEVRALMPHGEPLIVWHTVDVESPEIADWLCTSDSTVIGAEIIVPARETT